MDPKTLKKLYSTICRTKMDYSCQLYNTASPGRLKKLNGIHSEGIIIYKGPFGTSPIGALHVEANDPPLKRRWNKLGLKFLFKLKRTRGRGTTAIGRLPLGDGETAVAGPGRGSPRRVGPGGEPPDAGEAEPNPQPWVKWH